MTNLGDEQERGSWHGTRALSDVLDKLDLSLDGDEVTIDHIVSTMGRASFASLMLIFSLISTSPASAIPGVTATVAIIVLIIVIQMMIGRKSMWLPDILARRRLSTRKLAKGIAWLRHPVEAVERVLKPRLTFLFHRPWIWLPMSLIAGLTLFMPVMELVPMSGSIASAVIALFAASLLTRDGVLAFLAFGVMLLVPATIFLV